MWIYEILIRLSISTTLIREGDVTGWQILARLWGLLMFHIPQDQFAVHGWDLRGEARQVCCRVSDILCASQSSWAHEWLERHACGLREAVLLLIWRPKWRFLSIDSLPIGDGTRQIWRPCGPSHSKFLIKVTMYLRSRWVDFAAESRRCQAH